MTPRLLQAQPMLQKWVGLVSTVCNQLYYPAEHIAWAADHQLLPINSTPIWTVCILLWAIPLLISLVLSIWQLVTTIYSHKHRNSSSCKAQRVKLTLDILQTTCDLFLAVYWMSKGFLWGGNLAAVWWGGLGTISSLIGLYKTRPQ